ncbi:HEAT domain containing protein [Halorhabdus tiamatea SARL4B]|uniref:HEAT domain containing protein n=1 Tax=Halorhabdus tiamatea SARL4B TaxID=1033806 RepID=F7PL56_9EURY|nr:hypothetical protein [Halorhabdus tiamatea]ERJ05867.1 HEAT domain containing protein [Halorhabdus tiamatea SARL4B]CCQ34453.1 conserved hypothetical protein containing Armadillo-type fold [Halorhabdus tiamatea SARL4B]
MTANATGDVESLVERAEEEPTSVTAEDVRPFLEADDDIVRKRALDVCQAVGYVDSDRIAPLIPDILTFVEDDFLAVKHSALGAIGHLVPDEPDAVAKGVQALTRELTGETPLTRFLAAKSVALLAFERPAVVAGHAEELVAALGQEGPTLPESKQTTFADPDDPVREEVGKNVAQNENARELTAKALVAVAETDPDAIAPHLEALRPYVDDQNEIVAGPLLEIVSTLAAEDYAVPDGVAERVEATLPNGSTQLQARSLRALGYLSATDAVDTVRTVAEEAEDDELAAFAADTAEWLESVDDES